MDLIDTCLSSIYHYILAGVKIIFIDNNSTDKSFQHAQTKYPDLIFIKNNSNLLFAKGNNIGIKRALKYGSKYIFILNNDTEMKPGSLEILYDFMEKNELAGACQPILCSMNNPDAIASAGCRLSLSGKAWDHLNGESILKAGAEPFEILGATGGALFLRAQALNNVGLFDELFEIYFEDVDLSLRIRSVGYSIWCLPSAKVLHKGSATTSTLNRSFKLYYCERNAFYIINKHIHQPVRFLSIVTLLSTNFFLIVYNLFVNKNANAYTIFKAMINGLNHIIKNDRGKKRKSVFWKLIDSTRIFP